jgi:hypothetical protein
LSRFVYINALTTKKVSLIRKMASRASIQAEMLLSQQNKHLFKSEGDLCTSKLIASENKDFYTHPLGQ